MHFLALYSIIALITEVKNVLGASGKEKNQIVFYNVLTSVLLKWKLHACQEVFDIHKAFFFPCHITPKNNETYRVTWTWLAQPHFTDKKTPQLHP